MTSEDTVIQEDGFGFVPRTLEASSDKKPFRIVRRYTMTNKNEATVRLISWGAGIQSIRVPNGRGVFGDILLGFDNMDGYLKNRHIGRIINSVTDKPVHIDEKNCSNSENVTTEICRSNEKIHDLDNVNWESCVSEKQVIMSYVSRTRQRHRFRDMLIQVKYSWTDKNELNVNIQATVTESTPINLTICCPMNLAGHGTGATELKNHILTINSDKFVSIKPEDKCSKGIDYVDGTVYDFRNPTKLKNRLRDIAGGGYDHSMCINSPSKFCYRYHGRILHPNSGRFLEIYSNRGNLKFSTVNNFPDNEPECPAQPEDYKWRCCGDVPNDKTLVDAKTTKERMEIRGKDGALYRRHGAFIFSPQNYFNEKIRSAKCILHPGQVFVHNISYKFGVKSGQSLKSISHEV